MDKTKICEKISRNKGKIIIFCAAILAIGVCLLCCKILLGKNNGKGNELSAGVTFYGFSSEDNLVKVTTAGDTNLTILTEKIAEEQGLSLDRPWICVGEAENSSSHTTVKVYNEYSLLYSEFLAFPQNCLGGVNVAGGEIIDNDGKTHKLVACAACIAGTNEAKKVRVFNADGSLYMEIVPEFYENAPYSILVGNFSEKEEGEELFVATKSGNIQFAVYSLKTGELLENGSADINGALSKKTGETTDSVIVFETITTTDENRNKTTTYNVYLLEIDGSYTKTDVVADENTTGISDSAFSEYDYFESVKRDTTQGALAILKGITKASDGSLTTKNIDVAHFENTFFWSGNFYANDSEFVKQTDLNRLTTDFVYDENANFGYAFWYVSCEESDSAYNDYLMYKDALIELYKLYKAETEHFAGLLVSGPKELLALTLAVGFPTEIICTENDGEDVAEVFASGTNFATDSSELLNYERFNEELLNNDLLNSSLLEDENSFKSLFNSELYSTDVFSAGDDNLYDFAVSSGLKNNCVINFDYDEDRIDSEYDETRTSKSYRSDEAILTAKRSRALTELYYLFYSGVKFVDFGDNAGEAMQYAMQKIVLGNTRRYGSNGGTKSSVAYKNAETCYQIVETGGTLGENSSVIIKSVDKDGNATGDIYFSPMRTKLSVSYFTYTTNAHSASKSATFGDVYAGDCIVIDYLGKYVGTGECNLIVDILSDGKKIDSLTARFNIGSDKEPYKYILYCDDSIEKISVAVRFESADNSKVKTDYFCGNIIRQSAADPENEKYTSKQGLGVNFCVIG